MRKQRLLDELYFNFSSKDGREQYCEWNSGEALALKDGESALIAGQSHKVGESPSLWLRSQVGNEICYSGIYPDANDNKDLIDVATWFQREKAALRLFSAGIGMAQLHYSAAHGASRGDDDHPSVAIPALSIESSALGEVLCMSIHGEQPLPVQAYIYPSESEAHRMERMSQYMAVYPDNTTYYMAGSDGVMLMANTSTTDTHVVEVLASYQDYQYTESDSQLSM